MARNVIRPVPLYQCHNWPQHIMTYLTGYGGAHRLGIYVWYIEVPDKNILVDAGGTPEAMRAALPVVAPDASVEHIQSLEEGLGRVGLAPEDIDVVLVTHLHLDHIELGCRLPRARFVVQKAELDFALNPHPIVAGFYPRRFFEDLDFEVVEGDVEVAEGVKLLLTPGHTPGAQSVAVETEAGLAVITGFCCLDPNFNPPPALREFMPIITPGIHLDAIQAYESVVKVKDLADIVIPAHEPRFIGMERIPW